MKYCKDCKHLEHIGQPGGFICRALPPPIRYDPVTGPYHGGHINPYRAREPWPSYYQTPPPDEYCGPEARLFEPKEKADVTDLFPVPNPPQ